MNKIKRFVAVAVAGVLLSVPIVAQQKRPATPKAPVPAPAPPPATTAAPTFDALLAADSYKIYCEVRGVGQLIRSQGLNDILDPFIKLGGPPKELQRAMKWLATHADALSGSRMLVASWPSRPKLPSVLVAIEFASAEEAQKFDPEMRRFIPTLFPSPTPTPASPAPPNSDETAVNSIQVERSVPRLLVKQAGTLVLLSDQPFEFRDLKPRGSVLLAEDSNFATSRNRFSSEQAFLFVDLKSIDKEEKERQKRFEEEELRRMEAAATATPGPTPPVVSEPEEPVNVSTELSAAPDVHDPDAPRATLSASVETERPAPSTDVTTSAASSEEANEMNGAFTSIYTGLFGGPSKWPEAVGAAIVFENDGYIVRALVLNGAETKGNAVPMLPQLISGPAVVPAAPSVLPADIDLFVTASLDYPQIYEGMLKAIAASEETARKFRKQNMMAPPPPAPPFAYFEKKLGMKVKEDLLPLLGNEVSLALLKKMPYGPPTGPAEPNAIRAFEPIPVIAVSVKDKEAVKKLLPRVIEAFGLKGANLFAQTEKRGDTEIISYANIFGYALIGDFLVFSPNVAATRLAVDAYLNNQTLASDSHFRNYTRWQPRQLQGQIYIAQSMMDWYSPMGRNMSDGANPKLGEFVSRLDPRIDPLTYALTNDGDGPLHEMHIPKNLVLTMIAGTFFGSGQSPQATNEAIAKGTLRVIASAQATYQSTKGNGQYGSLDQLIAAELIPKDMTAKYGYRVEVTTTGKSFAATAVPVAYGDSGKLSFFIDESGVLRGGDHGGGAATVADQPER